MKRRVFLGLPVILGILFISGIYFMPQTMWRIPIISG